jgi:hypothetical protein
VTWQTIVNQYFNPKAGITVKRAPGSADMLIGDSPSGNVLLCPGAPTNGGCGPGTACDPATLSQYNYQDLQGGVDVRLKFLPETAAIFTSTYDARFYSDTAANPNASELKLQIGLVGLITTKISAIIKAGWAQGFGTGSISTVISSVGRSP